MQAVQLIHIALLQSVDITEGRGGGGGGGGRKGGGEGRGGEGRGRGGEGRGRGGEGEGREYVNTTMVGFHSLTQRMKNQ